MSANQTDDGGRRSRSRSRGGGGGGNGGGATGLQQNYNRGGSGNGTEFPLRILVSSEMVGAIIGRSGATIRSITQSTRARVDVHRKENVGSIEKAITIYGSPEACSEACKKLLTVMEAEASSTNKGEISLKILAHNSLIGRIIGKGGATIKKIMNDSDTKINVSSVSEVSPGLNIERVISIRGSVDGMSIAETLISAKLRNSYENDLQALTPGGLVGGLFPGLHPMAMLSNTGQVPGHHPGHHHHHYPGAAAAAAAHLTTAATSHHHNSRLGQGSIQQPYPLLPPHGGINPANPTPGNLQQLQQSETVSMWIPNNSVGAVIGTKGSFIRNIIRFSGASVKIATSESSKGSSSESNTGLNPERQVTIIGSAEAQWKAQCMIFEKIREEGFGGLLGPNEEPRLSIELSVPSNQVGRIIGKGGGNVRELQRLTGAIIKFPSAAAAAATATAPSTDPSNQSTNNPTTPPSNEQTSVHINGSFYSVQSAQRRIRAMLTPTTPQSSSTISNHLIGAGNPTGQQPTTRVQ